MSTQERIDEVYDRINSVARSLFSGTQNDLWKHSPAKLRKMTRRLNVLSWGLTYLKIEANAIHAAA